MKIPLEYLQKSVSDSASFGDDIPELLLSEFLFSLENQADALFSKTIEYETELKFRAALNSLVHESLRKDSSNAKETNISYFIPRLSEILINSENNLDLVLVENKLVIFTPKNRQALAVRELIESLNGLMDRSHGAKTWILNLSLIPQIPLELFAFLIGLKMTLNRHQINLDLMWLKKEAVPTELLNSIQTHFNLYSKGAFLLSS